MISKPTFLIIIIIQFTTSKLFDLDAMTPEAWLIEALVFLGAVLIGYSAKIASKYQSQEEIKPWSAVAVFFLSLFFALIVNLFILHLSWDVPRFALICIASYLSESVILFYEKNRDTILWGLLKKRGIEKDKTDG